MTGTKCDIEKLDEKNDFRLCRVRMRALLEHQGLDPALDELLAATTITKETTAEGIRKNLKTLYMSMSLAKHLYLKKRLYTFHMHPGKSLSKHIDEFHKLVDDLAAMDTAISDKVQALLLPTSLPSSYNNFVKTLLYGQDTLKLEDVLTILISSELQKMTEAKGDGDEGSLGFTTVMIIEQLLDWIMDSGGSYHMTYKKDYLVDFEEYDSVNVLLGYGRECRVWGMGIASRVYIYIVNRPPSSAIRFEVPINMLGFFCWLASIKHGMLEPVLYRNMGFNESREYKKTFIGSGVGTGSVQVLQGVEFEVEPHEDHTFEGVTLSTCRYREDSNKAAFAVAAVEKIYAHESLTFNDTVAYEVISKWKAGLKEDMDARSDVYVLSNGC
ncbi:hypothetical protein Tco_0865428, partial [Tanacetum coccineum]